MSIEKGGIQMACWEYHGGSSSKDVLDQQFNIYRPRDEQL